MNSQVNKSSMSAAIDEIHEAFLPINDEADKQLQKFIILVKPGRGEKFLTAIAVGREI